MLLTTEGLAVPLESQMIAGLIDLIRLMHTNVEPIEMFILSLLYLATDSSDSEPVFGISNTG